MYSRSSVKPISSQSTNYIYSSPQLNPLSNIHSPLSDDRSISSNTTDASTQKANVLIIAFVCCKIDVGTHLRHCYRFYRGEVTIQLRSETVRLRRGKHTLHANTAYTAARKYLITCLMNHVSNSALSVNQMWMFELLYA